VADHFHTVKRARRDVALACAFAFAFPLLAAAQSTPPDTGAARKPTPTLDTTVVTGRTSDMVGVATSANQGTVGAADLSLRPLLRPAETVENVPGVIVTQHSGSGKANQYFLRGFNLDHGTDLAISADGIPVNMPTHAHGQGYADLNFLIPELIEGVDYKKGPYYADVGDFGSAGAFNIRYYDKLPAGIAIADGGQVGYGRALVANNLAAAGGNLIYAGEYEHNDGPWTIGDNEQKFDGMLRFTNGDEQRGLTITATAYHNAWHSTDQVPDRAITEGLISPWGEIDTTDAGNTGRYALSADWHTRDAASSSHVMVYALHYDLDLFSDFTYFLDDPVHGDQIEQQDNRGVFGAKASHSWIGTLLGASSETTIGIQLRDDEIRNGLYHTEARVRLNAVTVNDISETNAAPYVESRVWWSDWFRTVVGLRLDAFWLDVRNIAGGNAGYVQSSLPSPKLDLVFGPWKNTEYYIDAGYGFHSNDARGVVATVNPATALPRSFGAEVGARTGLLPGLQSSVSLWMLDLNSELVWDGDAGTDDPSGPTRRYGIELANFYTPLHWLTIDADYAWSHARFTDYEPAGNYVPEALVATFDGGIAVHDLDGALSNYSGGLRWRYFGPRPLTQNDSVSSKATSLVYADLGYRINDRWRVALDVFNLFDTRASDIDYFYVSRLRGEPLAGVADVHTHPAEPRELRLSINAGWPAR
jgi:TonB dependent receptor/TonB-dependent Receptor Plug Domain